MREGSPTPPCHMSHVTCHMSRTTCHMSLITCMYIFFWGQSGEASRWRVCYQWGLPRLVLRHFVYRPVGRFSTIHNVSVENNKGLLPSASLPGNDGFELGNLATWQLGNLVSWLLGNLVTR